VIGDDLSWLKVDRQSKREYDDSARRLARVRLDDPASVAAAQRRTNQFWGVLGMARQSNRITVTENAGDLVPLRIYGPLMYVPRIDGVLAFFTSTPPGINGLREPVRAAMGPRPGKVWSLNPDGRIADMIDWPAHVQWGADCLVETVRHLAGGRPIAAAVIARSQLERWTYNVEHHHEIEPVRDEEGTADWISRVWSVYPAIAINMGQAWSDLSEFLHARGPLVAGQQWAVEAGRVGRIRYVPSSDTHALHGRIAEIASATFRQVLGCVATIARERGREDWVPLFQSEFFISDETDNSSHRWPPPIVSWPMAPEVAFGSWAKTNRSAAIGYRLEVTQAAAKDRVAAIETNRVIAAVAERRARASDRFALAWQTEYEIEGDNFQPGALAARLFRYIAITEAAEVVAGWSATENERAALLMAAGALRSASYFWLEDTDLSLPCIRTLLEQTCVARAWRMKPERAAKLAAQAPMRQSPARWIEAAGWRRAAVVGRALGEFSHTSLRQRTTGARRLLTDLQPEQTEPDPHAPLTARRYALDTTAYLLAHEVIARLEAADADLGAPSSLSESFRDQVTLMNAEEHQAMLDNLLARSLSLREFDFGLPDFGPGETAASESDPSQDDVGVGPEAETVPGVTEIIDTSAD
jgi:hypothetical protein